MTSEKAPDAEELRAFRKRHGFTQATLGELLGTKPAAVSHWETGRRRLPDHISRRLERLDAELHADASGPEAITVVVGEARMSDGVLSPFSWDAGIVTAPAPERGRNLRAVVLRDEGRNVEINGWLAFFALDNDIRPDTLAIIKLCDGRGLIGFLRRKNRTLDFESFFGEHHEREVAVESCYPVLWMKAPS